MDSKIFNIYKTESDILEKAIDLATKLCIDGTKIYDISSTTDSYIKDELSKIYKNKRKGLAMPTCISVNSMVAHYSPNSNDEYKLKNGDIVRIEMASFIEKYVSSVGDTIKVGDNDFNNSDEMNAAKLALSTGIKLIDPFTKTKDFDKLIGEVAKCYELNTLKRPYVFNEEEATLQYDWAIRDNNKFLEQSWIVRCDEELDLLDLNEYDDQDFKRDTHFNIGDVYHLEIAFCKTNKLASVSEKKATLFQKTFRKHALKIKHSRNILSQINKNNLDYLFNFSNLDMKEVQIKLGLNECKRHNVVRELGLIEQKHSDVIRFKSTIVIQENSVYVLTGKKHIMINGEDKLTPKLRKIFKRNIKFSKRDMDLEFS
jgi:methionine aminopeptidase